ncbi:MAG: phospho-sugar mutase [Acutalibacteraceae bacterium]|nr:phospho-sugar mutase [Acutalibacteraceae bacterium]
MDYKAKYQEWLGFDEETKAELLAITDEKEIEDRFYKDLEFGTGGLRGVMGAGANRMNKYTVSKATKGLADYLIDEYKENISVAIAYDSRNNSAQFAAFAAEVLCANGIKVFLYDTLMPTPVLSFTVKHLGCTAGIVLTASHNPKEYNGYKIYDENGCQLVPQYANKVIDFVNAVTDIKNVAHMPLDEAKEKGLFVSIGMEVLDAFLEAVKKQSLYEEKSDIKIVYTALHGTGNIPVRKAIEGMNVSIVKEQELPDGNFSTVRSPNPEEKDALTLALKQAEAEGADLVFGTDPDCDRIGAGVKHDGKYVLITGNQMGALLVNFVLTMRKAELNDKSTLVKTIVTSELGANIARKFGLNIVETLTGFKYIGEKINQYEASGDREFVIGYEESYGYLTGTHARDKDAVVSALLVCQMAAYYYNKGMTLIDALNEIYAEYGFYLDALDTFTLKGIDGAQKIQSLMNEFRENGSKFFDGIKEVFDFSKGIGDLPKENVLKYVFNDGSWMAIRPSGTEPKIKLYYSIQDADRENAYARLDAIRAKMSEIVEA